MVEERRRSFAIEQRERRAPATAAKGGGVDNKEESVHNVSWLTNLHKNMAKIQPDKRARLIETTMKLAYKHGFRETSLADIAEAARVPVGNVYYYFKTKDELGEAVVERRLAEFRAFRDEMDRLSSPKERLFAFVESIHSNKEQLGRGVCPLAGLCTEVVKEGWPLA